MLSFSVLKTGVEVSPLFFAVLTLFLLADTNGIAFPAVIFSFAHEAGHFLALLFLKTSPKKVSISLAGIHMELPRDLCTAKKITVLCAGFATNFFMAFLFHALGKPVFALINIIIGIFTMLPLCSTDGGSIVKELFALYFEDKGKRIQKMFFICACAVFSLFLLAASAAAKNCYLLISLLYLWACTVKC